MLVRLFCIFVEKNIAEEMVGVGLNKKVLGNLWEHTNIGPLPAKPLGKRMVLS